MWMFIFILFLNIFIRSSFSLQFDILPQDLKCISQEFDHTDKVAFIFGGTSNTRDPKQKLTVVVSDPDDETIIDEKIPIGTKLREYDHTVDKTGLYEMCFELYGGRTPVRVFFHVDYKLISKDGVDLSRKVSQEDIPSLQTELNIINEKLKDLSQEIDHSRQQEIFLKQAGEVTSTRIQWFSILSMAILLGMSIWQIIYLRNFFSSKKLL